MGGARWTMGTATTKTLTVTRGPTMGTGRSFHCRALRGCPPPPPPPPPPHLPPLDAVVVTAAVVTALRVGDITTVGATEEYKEFIDAESLMPLPTSDFRSLVCLEMKTLRNAFGSAAALEVAGLGSVGRGVSLAAVGAGGGMAGAGAPNDLGSVDSSDTYASCHTHPFLSQGDLTSEAGDGGCALVDLSLAAADSNLYVNPLDSQRSPDASPMQAHAAVGSSPGLLALPAPPDSGAASGGGGGGRMGGAERGLRSLGASPMEEAFEGFGASFHPGGPCPCTASSTALGGSGGADARGSRGSLDDAPVPKHRKTRFQQGAKPRTRFGDTWSSGGGGGGGGGGRTAASESQDSLERRSSRKSTFAPARSLASATRIINQHLFGLQTLGGGGRAGKNGAASKSSLSVDSLDSRAGGAAGSPSFEAHRRSKSILKKSDVGGGGGSSHRGGSRHDPEMERLISSGGAGSGDGGSGSESSPQKKPLAATAAPSPTATPAPARRVSSAPAATSGSAGPLRAIGPKAAPKPRALPIKFVGLGGNSVSSGSDKASIVSSTARRLKSPLLLLDDLLGGEKHSRDEATVENKHKERLEPSAATAAAALLGGGCTAAPGDAGGCCVSGDARALYICPPTGSGAHGDEGSPTEETKLLQGSAAAQVGGHPHHHHHHHHHMPPKS